MQNPCKCAVGGAWVCVHGGGGQGGYISTCYAMGQGTSNVVSEQIAHIAHCLTIHCSPTILF